MMKYESVLRKLKSHLMLLRGILVTEIHYLLKLRSHLTYDKRYCGGLSMVLGSL
jgi:hypothetical protein